MRRRFLTAGGVAVLVTLAAVTLARRPEVPKLRLGGLYSVTLDAGTAFGVAKILALDEAVHVRVYRCRFSARPTRLDEKTLSTPSSYDPRAPGWEHVPLSRHAFGSWKPVFVQQSVVSGEELVEYYAWRKEGGGVWQ